MEAIPASEKTNLMALKKSKRRKWTQDETKLFLKCFLQRKHEFLSRKKKFAYKRVLKDMFAQGFKDKSVTHSNLEGKMRTLSIAYNACKDEIFPNKASAYIKPYIKELDDIFVTHHPSKSSAEENLFIKTENDFEDNEMDSSNHSETNDPLRAQNTTNTTTGSNLFETDVKSSERPASVKTDVNFTEHENLHKFSAQNEYYEAMLEYKRRDLILKAKFYDEMMAMEKQKLELLKKIADNLCKP